MVIGLCIGIGGGYFVYEYYVWPNLNEWHLERIERQLEANFASHQKQFEAFMEYAEALPDFGPLEFDEYSDPILPDLLAYQGISAQEFLQLQQKVKALDCIAFQKDHDLIVLRYRGHSLESLDYVILLKDTPDRSNWTHLQGNLYWQHRREELFCGWTNWSRY